MDQYTSIFADYDPNLTWYWPQNWANINENLCWPQLQVQKLGEYHFFWKSTKIWIFQFGSQKSIFDSKITFCGFSVPELCFLQSQIIFFIKMIFFLSGEIETTKKMVSRCSTQKHQKTVYFLRISGFEKIRLSGILLYRYSKPVLLLRVRFTGILNWYSI